MKHRNTGYIVQHALQNYNSAITNHLMQVTIRGRNKKKVTMPNGNEVVEFINCSYLGIDQHPDVIAASKNLSDEWGVNFCCARSRFSIEPTRILEDQLSELFRGRAITFPSVSTTHMSVLPLLASGVLIDPNNPPAVRMIFDKFAHSSMQYLKPILASEATVVNIDHNNLQQLREEVLAGHAQGQISVYVADGIYSMGGLCPIKEILQLANELNFYIYLDDAHGTSIFGEKGEGSVMSNLTGQLPENLFISFCLSKGFGCNGGGILLPTKQCEHIIRSFGQIYAFSAALDFSVVNACLASVNLHRDGTVKKLQQQLRTQVAYYDDLMDLDLPFSPIRMVDVGDEKDAIELAKNILAQGYFVSTVFFPIVRRGHAQLRICLSARHTEEEIYGLTEQIKNLMASNITRNMESMFSLQY